MNSPLFLTAALGRGCPFAAAAVPRGGCLQRNRSGILFWILVFLFGGLIRVLPAAEITTDKFDYPPFSEVIITGSGFAAGEEVQLQLETLDADGVTWSVLPDDPVWPNPWTVTADAGGGIADVWVVYTEDFLGVSFRLTATGSQSGETAVAAFTDSAGAYSLNFAAADPGEYIPPIPFPETVGAVIVGRGNGDTRIPTAWFESPVTNADVKVESLAPETMALHQIVPFELRITVNGDTAPENGTITFKAGWNIDTTSNDDFGYDETYGVIAAFVDTGDGEHVDPGGDATVSSFSWAVVGDEIVGTFVVTGLDDDDVVVIEPWLVLEDSIPAGSTGNVQSRLISADTVPVGDKAISTGNQTVPLLRVQEFFTADADVSVEKSAEPVCLGENITYDIKVTNNSDDTVANGVVVTDTLGANQTFVSAAGAPYEVVGQVVTFTVGAMTPGQMIELTVVATPTVSGSVSNGVTVDAITDDPDSSNNSDSTTTTVHPLPPCEITGDTLLVAGQPATFFGPEGMASYAWSVSYNGEAAEPLVGDLAELEIVIPEDAEYGTLYLTVTNEFGCSRSCELELEAISTGCGGILPPACPGEDQVVTLDLPAPPGSVIVWSILPADGPAVLDVAEDELSATVSSPTCAEFEVSVEVTQPSGSTITCTTSGSFVDDADPVLPELPAGGDLGCNPLPPACVEVPDAEDFCGPVPVLCTPGAVDVIGCSRSQTFTYTATDACGNEASGEVTYTWKVDSTDPVLPDLPDGGDLGCNPTLPQCVTGLEATDDCDGLVAVTCTPGQIEEDDCVRRQTFTYAAEDVCGNKASDTVVYSWKVDTTDPVLPDLPDGGDLGCNPVMPQCVTGLEATDDCDGLVAVTCTPGQIEEDGCVRRQTFTYAAEDVCGNKASDTVVYSWKVDTTDPVLPDLPDGGDLGCNPVLPQCVTGLEATDDCDGLVAVTCTPGQIEEDGCVRRQAFTYAAEDVCGNEASDTVTYEWTEDTTDPVLPDLPAGGDLGCNPALPQCDDSLEAQDNCGTVPVICTAGPVTGEGCEKSQSFTYSAKDACENEVSDTVTYTWTEDVTDPVLPDLPTGGDLGCNPDLPQCEDVGMAEDGCGQVPVICSAGPITGDCRKS